MYKEESGEGTRYKQSRRRNWGYEM